jgi:hydrogenase maturation protein HypF
MSGAVEIRVRGQVQGVGFRPFVWGVARRFGVSGWVRNDAEGVLIGASGGQVDAFIAAIRGEAPPLARVDAVEVVEVEGAFAGPFEIVASGGAGAETRVTPDAAVCEACLGEVMDAGDRRFGYPFANCTHCGPRFSIISGLPYDRAMTSMARFPMCEACRAEYEDPADRRFHAQPVACADCGPRVWLEPEVEGDPIAEAAARLRAGQILAVKGIGGFHLVCDALNADAIATLRTRKHRPAKPLAVMAEMETIERYAVMGYGAHEALCDPAAPIVVLEEGEARLPDGIAPGQGMVGWMLPYTPLHHLLIRAVGGPLVMTSGNLSGEPQVIGNQEARDKLAAIVDGFVMHDRDIARRLDDSVEGLMRWGRMVLRRARGQVPGTIPLPPGFEGAPQVVAYGGQMKSAICLIKNGQALLGHHLGELDEALTWDAFVEADADYAALFDHRPEVVAVDLHPEYRATKHGQARADREGLRLEEVQHHHAHLASCLAECGWPLDGSKVVGLILDGTGLGADGTLWGGEVLIGDYHGFDRFDYLKPAPLIGGDMAAREPWRNALARLDQAGLADEADRLFAGKPLAMARMAAERGVNAPMSSSMGRLFDAVAAILGICPDGQSYEGEAAMRLEALARSADVGRAAMPYEGVDPSEMTRHIVTQRAAGAEIADLAHAFHLWVARCFADVVQTAQAKSGAKAVVLSGGCFQNRVLLEMMVNALADTSVMIHEKTPANDGSLALGQAVIAAARCL